MGIRSSKPYDKIVDQIYLGSSEALEAKKFSDILSLRDVKPFYPELQAGARTKFIKVADVEKKELIIRTFESAIAFIEEAIKDKNREILIHCPNNSFKEQLTVWGKINCTLDLNSDLLCTILFSDVEELITRFPEETHWQKNYGIILTRIMLPQPPPAIENVLSEWGYVCNKCQIVITEAKYNSHHEGSNFCSSDAIELHPNYLLETVDLESPIQIQQITCPRNGCNSILGEYHKNGYACECGNITYPGLMLKSNKVSWVAKPVQPFPVDRAEQRRIVK